MPSNNSASDRGVKFEPLKNKAAIDFLKNKVPEVTKHWDDWLAPMHAHSFTIAGAPSVDFVKDMQAALVSNIEQGLTIADFRKKFDVIVKDYGWSYNGKRGWRTKVIYQTNMRSARMAALWQQIQTNKDVAPYLEYVSVLDGRTTKNCKAWDDLVLPVDDVFWMTHYPPNHWGCRATVRQLSETSLLRLNKSVGTSPLINRRDVVNQGTGEVYHNVPQGIAPGWDYNVGQSWLAPDVAMGKKLAALPDLMADNALHNILSLSFKNALNKSWTQFIHKAALRNYVNNDVHIVGYLPRSIQNKLNSDDFLAKIKAATDDYNARQNKEHRKRVAATWFNFKNVTIVAQEREMKHYAGLHRAGSPHDWEEEWVRAIPSDILNAEYIFYDIVGHSIGILTKHSTTYKGVVRYGIIYIRPNQIIEGVSSSLDPDVLMISLNTKPLSDIKKFIVPIQGELPK
ncbi:MAG: phage head morphogenesis protein [Burkholderiales bacterium]|nr:phage head morphogenesis protein [Burkholderiales bacterium]